MNVPLDMTRFIEAKSDQLNADDLLSGPRTITIRKVAAGESAEQPINIFYDGDDGKAFRPCKTIRRVMVACWGSDANAYVGRSMTLYRDAEVMFGGMKVGGLRVSHMSHIDGAQTVVVMKTKGKKAPMKVLPLQQRANTPAAAPPAAAADAPQPDAGQSTGAASTEDKAADWLGSYVADLGDCLTQADVMALRERHSRALGKLSKERPELSQIATDASTARYEALADVADVEPEY